MTQKKIDWERGLKEVRWFWDGSRRPERYGFGAHVVLKDTEECFPACKVAEALIKYTALVVEMKGCETIFGISITNRFVLDLTSMISKEKGWEITIAKFHNLLRWKVIAHDTTFHDLVFEISATSHETYWWLYEYTRIYVMFFRFFVSVANITCHLRDPLN